MDTTDQDDNDQHPDFRLLLSNPKSQGSSAQALPSKDTKSAQDPEAALEEQLDAYFHILGEVRRAAERTYSRAIYETETGLFRLTVNRGTHFVNMGHTLHGQIYLYPEEALYLVDRGSLLVDHHGTDMSVQQMWGLYLLQSQVQKQSQDQSQDPGEGSGAAPEQDGPSAMDRYLTYAYLKRLGFIVIRPGIYNHESHSKPNKSSTPPNQALTRPFFTMVRWWSALWSSLVASWRCRTSALVARIGLGLGAVADAWTRRPDRPLVSNDAQLSYDQVLQRLQIIPTMRLVHASESLDRCRTSSHPSLRDFEQVKRKSSIDFDVYKPAGAFKKRAPGIPDYRVVVVRPGATLPTLDELEVMMEGQPDPAQDVVRQSAPLEKGRKKQATDWPKVLFAVVDGGQVSFMNIFNIKAVP